MPPTPSRPISEWLSRQGARLGNWNDRRHGSLARRPNWRRWARIDRLAGALYVLPER